MPLKNNSKVWTPADRALWLSIHKAPPGMLLVDEREIDKVALTLKIQQGILQQVRAALGPYAIAHGNSLVEGTKAAVVAAESLRDEVRRLTEELDTLKSKPPAP